MCWPRDFEQSKACQAHPDQDVCWAQDACQRCEEKTVAQTGNGVLGRVFGSSFIIITLFNSNKKPLPGPMI